MRAAFMRAIMAMALFVVVAVPATMARAESPVLTAISTQQAEGLFRDMGFTGIETDSDGDLIVTMQGMRVLVLVGSAKGQMMQFRFAIAGSDANMRKINDWNRTKQYSRAYLDDDGDPVLESEQDLTGGVTLDRLRDFIKTYNTSLSVFLKEVV